MTDIERLDQLIEEQMEDYAQQIHKVEALEQKRLDTKNHYDHMVNSLKNGVKQLHERYGLMKALNLTPLYWNKIDKLVDERNAKLQLVDAEIAEAKKDHKPHNYEFNRLFVDNAMYALKKMKEVRIQKGIWNHYDY